MLSRISIRHSWNEEGKVPSVYTIQDEEAETYVLQLRSVSSETM